jgi:hypothetical protein
MAWARGMDGGDYLPFWGSAAFRAVGGMKEEEDEENPGQWRRCGKEETR